MRPASASTLTLPSVEEAVPPPLLIWSTRLSTPPQFGSTSPCTLCSLATPVGAMSETTTIIPAAASARAVELPMPMGLPQPVIKATRAVLSMGSSLDLVDGVHSTIPRSAYESGGDNDTGRQAGTSRARAWRIVGIGDRARLHVAVRRLWRGR